MVMWRTPVYYPAGSTYAGPGLTALGQMFECLRSWGQDRVIWAGEEPVEVPQRTTVREYLAVQQGKQQLALASRQP